MASKRQSTPPAKAGDPGRDEAAPVSRRAERAAVPAGQTDHGAARPPGRVLSGRHGPQSRVLADTAVDRLRKLLNLSPTCDIEQVCADAATEIDRLRALKPERARSLYRGSQD